MADCRRKGYTAMKGDKSYANDHNKVYARFECHDFQKEGKDRVGILSEKIKNGDESEKNTAIGERSASES